MAHTKAIGSTKNGRDSVSKRLGVKLQDGQKVMLGQIIIRQRGTHYYPGKNVKRAADDTLFAMKDGQIKFSSKKRVGFNSIAKKVTLVSVI